MTADLIEILVVDDDSEIADLVEIYLSSAGYQVYKASGAREGMDIIRHREIKLVILDIMMPEIDGIEMCKRIRGIRNMPIIMLSAKTADADKIRGLTAGADDYMEKPFNPMELLARVKSQLRRYLEFNESGPETDQVIHVRHVTIDTARHQVLKGDREVALTPIEFNILSLLASHPGRVYSMDEIYENVWNERLYEANNTVMVHIRRLREKVELDPKKPELIKTVWGVGYKIES